MPTTSVKIRLPSSPCQSNDAISLSYREHHQRLRHADQGPAGLMSWPLAGLCAAGATCGGVTCGGATCGGVTCGGATGAPVFFPRPQSA